MKLVRLGIQNYRSIKNQWESQCVTLDSLNCFVGQNNAGKSNVLRAVRYLLRGETDRASIHYNHDMDLEVRVRGYFEIEDDDFERLKIEEKREAVRSQVLPDGTFGIYRCSADNDLKVLAMYPAEERLRPAAYFETRDTYWDRKTGPADFRDRMQEAFPEVAPYVDEGKETQKSAWERAYNGFVEARPEDIAFIELPGPPKQGIPADLLNLLPEPLLIPAVKEVSDATRTSSRAEFGALLSAVSEEIKDELDEAIATALQEVTKQLNLVTHPDTGEVTDERHRSVRQLEDTINRYVRETFEDHSIQLEFPNPRSGMIFDQAQLWVTERGFRRIPLEDVGEGVKRILIFGLIRTLADIRHGRLRLSEAGGEGDDNGVPRKPYLILYEEAELFLHPALQAILLAALRTLSASGDQVLFTTHSPFMVPSDESSALNVVRKNPTDGTCLLEASSRLQEHSENARRRLLGVRHLASYIFADTVILVEGDSDVVVLKKIAGRLNPDWDFDGRQIPVLSVAGRDNLPLFRRFLRSLGIRTFVMTDLDALRTALADFVLDGEIEEKRDELLTAAAEVVDAAGRGEVVNRREAERIVRECTWSDLFERLQEVQGRIAAGVEIHDGDAEALGRLLDLEREGRTRDAVASSDAPIGRLRSELQALLLEDDVLLLSGVLEDYYPYPGGNKIAAALEFNPQEIEPDQLRDHFTILPERDSTDVELFLRRVFET